jgi:hypothetical protein
MSIFTKDNLRAAVEAASGGLNTVLYTQNNSHPVYVYVLPKFRKEDIDPSLGTGVHEAFIVNGQEIPEIFVGMYQATVRDGQALSLPGVDVSVSLTVAQAQTYARANGTGWHVCTNATYAALALWMWKNKATNNVAVRGNTNFGRSHAATWETGRRIDGGLAPSSAGNPRIFTGSGPASWRHNGLPTGIADLVGNVWEFSPGMRLVDGEIQVIANNDAVLASVDMGVSSSAWRAIRLSDGALVDPGSVGTAKYDATSAVSNVPRLNSVIEFQKGTPGDDANTVGTDGNTPFSSLTSEASVTAPGILKSLYLYPIDGTHEGTLYVRNHGERFPVRGGNWTDGANAGPSALNLSLPRSHADNSFGFRPAFVA